MTAQPVVHFLNVVTTCIFCVTFMWMQTDDETRLRFYGIHSFLLLLITSHTCTNTTPYSDHDMLLDCMFIVFGLGSHAYVALVVMMELDTLCSILYCVYCLVLFANVIVHVQSLPVTHKQRKMSDPAEMQV
jgi:hypothetical protein